MPFDVSFGENLPAGYSMTAVRGGGTVQVCVREFVSSEDGDLFISRLEGIPQALISKLPATAGITPSVVDNMLAIIRPDRTGTIYINELKTRALIRTRRSVKVGEPVYASDILDIERLQFEGIDIPKNAGVAIILSVGWRKGFYYDLSPVSGKDAQPREYDLEIALGQYHAYLLFQDLFKLSQADWDEFFRQKWFPFIYLGQPLLLKMINHTRNQWSLDDLLPDIACETKGLLEQSASVWKNNPYAADHIPLLERAAERYLDDDFISASSNLYPRIEGIMRAYRSAAGIKTKPTGSNLTKAVIEKGQAIRHECSYLLPQNFSKYLEDVYFAEFKEGQKADMSRHTVAHGVAPADQFSLKSATIGFLLLYQLSLLLSPEKPNGATK